MIPKIIHQIYETRENTRVSRKIEEWTNSVHLCNNEFEYKFWNNGKEINDFVKQHFPALADRYKALPYDVQRWDILRLMILYVEGGVYVDTDVECFASFEPLVEGKTCAFALEPQAHATDLRMPYLVGSYFIAAEAGHPFIKLLIDEMMRHAFIRYSTHNPTQVMKTTGPLRLTELYQLHRSSYDVQLIDAAHVSPLSAKEVPDYMKGKYFESVENAVMLHLYTSSWATDIENKEELDFKDYLRSKKIGG